MLTKVLFTALVIAAAVLYLRHRTAGRVAASAPRATRAGDRWWRLLPALLLLGAVAVGGLVFWLEWQAQQRIFTVRVIDTRSGDVRSYLVHRDGLNGRRFTTVDGRTVVLADVERMELIEGDHGDAPAR